MIYSSQSHGKARVQETEYLEGWQRARAELENVRKRLASEQALRDQRARASLLANLLTVAEHFQAVVKHVPPDLQSQAWAQGVLHVAREFEQVLQDQGIEIINQTHIMFDPAVHEAVGQGKSKEAKSGLVLEIIQPGYKLGELILKPARVKISA